MKVNNGRCIRRLSLRSLRASGKRNRIAVLAIALTSMLFTALFTIALSMNASYQEYAFRQMGGYAHGAFKDVTEEQIKAISAHAKVRQTGERTVIGFMDEGAFAKKPAEISFMDENCTKWSYALPSVGRMPEDVQEVSMDTKSIELLGAKPELNTKITLTYEVGSGDENAFLKTDTFLLVGYWEEDDIMPAHYINISRSYADLVEREATEKGLAPFRTDLNVMMASSFDIRTQMEQVERDLGYTWEEQDTENVVRIGVNWGMTSEQLLQSSDPETVVGLLMFLIVILLTGYLIIYNLFQISIRNDVRYYGLLKTIGVTPRQLKRIIRHQAALLSLAGIPLGLLAGYGVGALLTPIILRSMNKMMPVTAISASPLIFAAAAGFALITVLISCMRPAGLAAKVSPVEAARYMEHTNSKRKNRRTHRGGLFQMACANLKRGSGKTVLVLFSLTFAIVLLNALYTFVAGFDMEKYLEKRSCADFVISSTDYFRTQPGVSEYIPDEVIEHIRQNVDMELSGSGYTIVDAYQPQVWMEEEQWRKLVSPYISAEAIEEEYKVAEKQDGRMAENVSVEGLDPELFGKLTLLEGDLSSVIEPESHGVAVVLPMDDYGNPYNEDAYPAIGDTLTVTYVKEGYFIDTRNGEFSDETTPQEYVQYHVADGTDVAYTVAAYVLCPSAMSFRYGTLGYELILPADQLREDSRQTVVPMFYLFDTPNRDSEQEAEEYLTELTAEYTNLMFESKDSVRRDFEGFRNMFLLVGGLLCAVIAFIGTLNFFNVIMTSILSRKKEFAVLQAVGMTNRQLKKMLISEGLLYTLGAIVLAAIISLALYPFLRAFMGSMFWFLRPHLTLLPIALCVPVFLLLGWLIPTALYGQTVRKSVVERLREIA